MSTVRDEAPVAGLLHPHGDIRELVVLGAAECPAWLTGGGHLLPAADAGTADVLLVMPNGQERADGRWLERAAARASELLAHDGIAIVLAPAGWRRRFIRLLHRHAPVQSRVFVHTRQGGWSDYLFTVDRAVLASMTETLRLSRRHQLLLRLMAVAPLGLVRRAARSGRRAMEVVQRRGARPLFDWASAAGGATLEGGGVMLRAKSRGPSETAVVSVFGRDAGESAIVKTALNPFAADRLARQVAVMPRLTAGAARAGAAVPELRPASFADGRGWLGMNMLRGIPAAVHLPREPQQLFPLLALLEHWLSAWAQLTCRALPADRARLDQEILTPAIRLAPLLARGESYVSWLHDQCDALLGTPLPAVATHGDLSMSNVLIADGAPLGIIDWDEARGDGLPLTDFFYASADAVAAASGYRDRVKAFAECCDPGTAAGAFVTAASHRLAGSIGLTPSATALLRHATALHHAGNEHLQDGAAERPFLAMVQILADSTTATAVM